MVFVQDQALHETVRPADPASRSHRASLSRAGAGMLTLLLLTALFYSIPALASQRMLSEVFRWLLVPSLLGAYWRGYQALQVSRRGQRLAIIGFAALFGLAALLIPPFHDIDLGCYINIGWTQSHYGLNPYACTLSEVPGWQLDPMFRPYWEFTPSAYGFLFDGLARLVCQAGNGHWWLTMQLFRAESALALGLTGCIVWSCCRRLGLGQPERSLYLLLWNPLLLMTAVVHGHNDILMALFVALAVWCALRDHWLPIVSALVAATLVKYVAASIIPFTLLFMVRRYGWRKTGCSTALGALVGMLLALPYLRELGQFQLSRGLATLTELHNSPAAAVYFPFEVASRWLPGLAPSGPGVVSAIKAVCWSAFVVFYGRLAWQRLRRGPQPLAVWLRDCVLVQFVLVCLVSSKFYPWYLGMFLPLALLLPAGDGLRRTVLAVSCAQLLSFTFINMAHFLNVVVMLGMPLWVALRWMPSGSAAPDRTRISAPGMSKPNSPTGQPQAA